MNPGLKVILSLIFRIIPLRLGIDQEDKGEELLSLCVVRGCLCDNCTPSFLPLLIFGWRTFSRRVTARWWRQSAKNQVSTNQNSRNRWCLIARRTICDIKFDIIDTCSTLNTDNEAITILLKNSQESTSISTTYVPPASTINTILLDNIKKSADNIIITGDLNATHTNFNCTKTDRWGMALKKALYKVDLFIADNSKPTHRDSRTNSSDIIDYIISSPAIFNKIQSLTLNKDLSSDHCAILFNFSTNFN